MSAVTAFVLGHQLALVFVAVVLIAAGMVTEERAAKRRRDREDAEAAMAAAARKLAAEVLAEGHLAVERYARHAVPEHGEAPIGRQP